jgi:hypothetical protein
MIRSFSPYAFLSSSNTGDIVLHGPHQVAKKSTNVGVGALMISLNFPMEQNYKL